MMNAEIKGGPLDGKFHTTASQARLFWYVSGNEMVGPERLIPNSESVGPEVLLHAGGAYVRHHLSTSSKPMHYVLIWDKRIGMVLDS